jgi:hypothetical protein
MCAIGGLNQKNQRINEIERDSVFLDGSIEGRIKRI